MALTMQQINDKLREIRGLEAELLGQAAGMTNQDRLQALEEAQPHVKPGTPQMEALLASGYGMTAAEAKQIIKERKDNPQAWPLEEARKAEAFLAAYEAKTRVPSSPRAGGRRG